MVKEGFYIVIVVGIIAAIAWVVGAVGPQAQAGAVAVANVQNAPILAQQTVEAGQQAAELRRKLNEQQVAAQKQQDDLVAKAREQEIANNQMIAGAIATKTFMEGQASVAEQKSSSQVAQGMLTLITIAVILFLTAGLFWVGSEQVGRHRQLSHAKNVVKLALGSGAGVKLPNGYEIQPRKLLGEPREQTPLEKSRREKVEVE